MMSPWLSVVLLGVAIFGFAWLTPARGRDERGENGNEAAYDRLLEDLETENRELLGAVSKFKQEQDETVKGLVKQIAILERQMKALSEQSAASAAIAVSVAAPPQEANPAAQTAASPAPEPPQSAQPEEAEPEPEPPFAPPSIRERYAELIALHDKGRSIEHIAKSAGMNKGEVQLILQLARREEDHLA